MKDLFIIVRVGVYDQGVVGVSRDLNVAKAIAEKYATQDRDSYHSFQIRRSSGDEFDIEVGTLKTLTLRDWTRSWTWNDSTDTSKIGGRDDGRP